MWAWPRQSFGGSTHSVSLYGGSTFVKSLTLSAVSAMGENFRERERIKRKKQRWTARLARMPVLERQALLSAIRDLNG